MKMIRLNHRIVLGDTELRSVRLKPDRDWPALRIKDPSVSAPSSLVT